MQQPRRPRCPRRQQQRVMPSTCDEDMRASRIAVPAAAFASPPPLPFVANTSAFADIGDVSVAAPWRSPRPYALIPGAGCDTGHVSMPTAPFETQLFSPAQRVGPTPRPSRPVAAPHGPRSATRSGAAPRIRGCLFHSWRHCKTYSSRQCASSCGVAVLRRPRRPP